MRKVDHLHQKYLWVGLGLMAISFCVSILMALIDVGLDLATIYMLTSMVSFAGLICLAIGIIKMIQASRNRQAITKILGGLLFALVGLVGTVVQINQDVSGVYIVNGIPIPLIVVFAVGAIIGVMFLFYGLREVNL